MKLRRPPVPEGSFTRKEFEEKLSLTCAQSNKRLQVLQTEGVIKKLGKYGSAVYYVLSDAKQ